VLRRISIILTILAAALALPGVAAAADDSAADVLYGNEVFEGADEGTVEAVDDDGNPPVANRPREPGGSGSGAYKVCAPNGKCVFIPYKEYCRLANGCGKPLWKRVNEPACSSSTGCFTVKGKSYRYIGNPPDRGPASRGAKCAVSLGYTEIAAYATRGPWGLVVAGVALAVWQC
jgi:hypothetical protein